MKIALAILITPLLLSFHIPASKELRLTQNTDTQQIAVLQFNVLRSAGNTYSQLILSHSMIRPGKHSKAPMPEVNLKHFMTVRHYVADTIYQQFNLDHPLYRTEEYNMQGRHVKKEVESKDGTLMVAVPKILDNDRIEIWENLELRDSKKLMTVKLDNLK